MPPKSRGTDVEMVGYEQTTDNSPQPSTLAAQLVDNISTRGQPLKQNDPEDFKKLLAEVHGFSNVPEGYIDPETKVDQGHKTIFLFVRLVLEPLTRDGLLLVSTQTISTACQAMQVLKKTIEETPAVLLHTADANSSNTTSGEVLWSWLFPRLLALIGRDLRTASQGTGGSNSMDDEGKIYEPLQNEISSFFNLAFRVASSINTKEGDLGMLLFSYLKDCINDAVVRISDPGLIANGPLLSPNLVLPAAQPNNSRTFSQDDTIIKSIRSSYIIQDAHNAHLHATRLLLILAQMLSALDVPYKAGLDYTAWVCDIIVFLIDVKKKWSFETVTRHSDRDLCLSFLHAIRTITPSSPEITPAAISCKFYMVAAKLCAECLEEPVMLLDAFINDTLCPSLLELASICKKFEPVSEIVKSSLLPTLSNLSAVDNSYFAKHKDFKLCCRYLQEQCALAGVTVMALPQSTFENVRLHQQFRYLGLEDSNDKPSQLDSPRPNKRQKMTTDLESEPGRDMLNEVIRNIHRLLGSQAADGLDGLERFAVESFAKLTSIDQCQTLENLGWVSCSSAGTLQVMRNMDGSIREAVCVICDLTNSKSRHPMSIDSEICHAAVKIMINLTCSPALVEAKQQRIFAMHALRKLATHFRDPQLLNVESSPLGQWCVQCVQSSVRELRIAAGRTLPVFLSDYTDSEILQKNRLHVIEVLRNLSDTSPIHLQETCILAWGQVGRVSVDDELNLVLLRLVQYLGHANLIVSGVAFNEISALAAAAGCSPKSLFSPFWRSVAVTAVKDLHTRPQTTQLMADLLAIPIPELLQMTQAFTLPWLVLSKKKDIVQRIAQAVGANDAWEICMNSKNLAPILALLLVQPVADQEEFVMASLKDISPKGFEGVDDVSHLIKIVPIEIAFEILNASGEANESKKSRTRYGLQFLASRIGAPTSSKQVKKTSHVGPFLEQHILGLVTHFSDAINDVQGWHPIAEKRRCLRGIEETVRIGKGYIASALPQICALLQSALPQNDLRVAAFSTWATIVKVLDSEDIKSILESTFAAIIQHWQNFEESSRQCALDLVGYLLKNRSDLVRECIDILPSLASISQMSTFEADLGKMKAKSDLRHRYQVLTSRIGHENASVVAQALLELSSFLRVHQSFLQASAVSEQPDTIVGRLLRGILDSCVKFSDSHPDIARLSAECIGLVGCLDSNRVEAVRERREIVVVSNFEELEETTNFVIFALEEVLVKAFLSASSNTAQNLLSYAMQDLLFKCNFSEVCSAHQKAGDHSETNPLYQKWLELPDPVRATLTPFLRSKYKIGGVRKTPCQYPIFQPSKKYTAWLRAFVLDLLQKAQNSNARLIFDSFCRVIRIQDISPATFLLPYVVLHVVVAGTERQAEDIFQELRRILEIRPVTDTHSERENIQLCSEAVFRVLDYLSRWVQEKKVAVGQLRASGGHTPSEASAEEGIMKVERLLAAFPAEIVSQRAVQCKSYARALFHWEAHIREVRGVAKSREKSDEDITSMLQRLQQIYTQIDEPDGIEGIATHLHVLDIDQQILGHRKAGRWTAAQNWYEIKLKEEPNNVDLQLNLLTCLKESGQHDVLLKYVDGLREPCLPLQKLLPSAAEACWMTGKWEDLSKYLKMIPLDVGGDFNIAVGHLLDALNRKNTLDFMDTIGALRESMALRLSGPTTDSIHACHDAMLRFHVLTDMEMIAGADEAQQGRVEVLESLGRRLEVIGAHPNDKQYLLGIRRAAMQLVDPRFTKLDVAAAWLTTAQLARKGNSIHESFNAVLRALQLGDESATIEQARLLWKEGHARQAIQTLQGAIATNKFISHNRGPLDGSTVSDTDGLIQHQNLLTARAHLLLAKWLDSAGQTQAQALQSQYQLAAKTHVSWEKGHYYLGRHYNKLVESEKHTAPEHQAEKYLTGEFAKLVIENYSRALNHGTKYIYQTLPRILTLWLDLATNVSQPIDRKHGNSAEFLARNKRGRDQQLSMIHSRMAKSIQKMPAYIFYTALPQIVARIAHPIQDVVKYLQQIINKVVTAHPQQALWCLLAVSKSMQDERKSRGDSCLAIIRKTPRKFEPGMLDFNNMIVRGERLVDQLLGACTTGEFSGNRTSMCSLTKDLNFHPKTCIPSPLAVPIESTLTATLPTLTDSVRSHKAFSRDVITISSFADEVLVLSSLAKPRKLTARGSDGRNYGLLCKPKDDLRKDQRLMEFNSMINRSLKRDAESSKRQLYIKTYAVTPLNEECGIIEWVDGLQTFRDILLGFYKAKGIVPMYGDIKLCLDEAMKDDSKLPFFTEKVLGNFPPMFHLWFVQQFPEPSAWFAARLKYTRSAAVMSMVGTILGLGDRHTENILFEEGSGGTFHVDFNCLFDKGLTFAQPEKVPFRLTHNMVDAMGVYGYEGPFRKSSELTLKILRQHEETLMTILEAFLHDPTLDLIPKKERRKRDGVPAAPDTPQAVLESIKRKVGGFLPGENIPLGVEGQVDELIKQAVNPKNLTAMYIGWCAFF